MSDAMTEMQAKEGREEEMSRGKGVSDIRSGGSGALTHMLRWPADGEPTLWVHSGSRGRGLLPVWLRLFLEGPSCH